MILNAWREFRQSQKAATKGGESEQLAELTKIAENLQAEVASILNERNDTVYYFDGQIPEPIKADGQFVSLKAESRISP